MRIRFDTRTFSVPRNGKRLAYPAVVLGIGTPGFRTFQKEVLIDTGSSHTILPLSLATHLGIDTKTLKSATFRSGSGHQLTGYLATVMLSIRDPENSRCGWDWESEILLANINTTLFGVLGHESFLEYFRFELDAEDFSFSIEENVTFPGDVLTYL